MAQVTEPWSIQNHWPAPKLLTTWRIASRSGISSSTFAAVVRRRWTTVSGRAPIIGISVTTSVSVFVAVSITVLVSRFSHVYAWSGSMCSLSNRKIYSDIFIINFHTAAFLLGYFGVLCFFKVHKGKSSRSASLGIDDDLNSFDWTVLAENVVQFVLVGVDAEPEDA